MSSAMQPALLSDATAHTLGCGRRVGRGFARQICQSLLLLPLFSLILQPEYVQVLGDLETKSILYRGTIGPLRIVDVALLGLIATHVIVWISSRRSRVDVPRSVAIPGIGFLLAIALAAIRGSLLGGANLFCDWRALALGVGMYVVFAMWLQTQDDVRSAMLLFAVFMTVRIGLFGWEFVGGGGDMVVGVRIPVFDGPTLSAVVFTVILAQCMSDGSAGLTQKLLWTGLSTGGCLLVLLCFRRTFWAELAIGTVILFVIQKPGRAQKLLLATVVVATTVGIMGPTFFERVQSLNFSSNESEFSQDNPDHVGEVLDAWEQVQKQPVLGIGMGRSFQTLRVPTWKEESVMVHNALLHVWLKYGLLGLVSYIWFHFAVFRRLWRIRKHDSVEKTRLPHRGAIRRSGPSSLVTADRRVSQKGPLATAIASAALAYLAAQFVVSLGFAPWPYSSLQSTTLIAFVLAMAMAMAGAHLCKPQPSR